MEESTATVPKDVPLPPPSMASATLPYSGRPPPSPLSGGYLLIVISETLTDAHKAVILQKLSKAFLSWNVEDSGIDIERELAVVTALSPEGDFAKNGERLIQNASEHLVTEILIHPQINTMRQCIRNLLSSFTKYRFIIHAGYVFCGNGSWILQDGTFSVSDFIDAFQEVEVQRVIRAYEKTVKIDICCIAEGGWTQSRLQQEPFSKLCQLEINPSDKIAPGNVAVREFIDYLEQYIIPSSIEHLLEPSDIVGNIRFTHPTLYVFPGGEGDAALFGINGFNMLVDGGFSKKACFWNFVRHLDRLDAVLMTRVNNCNIGGMSGVVERKVFSHVYPQVGHFFSNLQGHKQLPSPDGDKDREPLLVNLIEEGDRMVMNLKQLQLKPHHCYRDAASEPINLYHKVGHGKLDMYVISPAKDSREVKEFLSRWNNHDVRLFSGTSKTGNRELRVPLQNLVSICALLVWQPANPDEHITRILFPGSTPQHKIFEGLERLKALEFLKHSTCTVKSVMPAQTPLVAKPTAKKFVSKLEKQEKILDELAKSEAQRKSSLAANENEVDSGPRSLPVDLVAPAGAVKHAPFKPKRTVGKLTEKTVMKETKSKTEHVVKESSTKYERSSVADGVTSNKNAADSQTGAGITKETIEKKKFERKPVQRPTVPPPKPKPSASSNEEKKSTESDKSGSPTTPKKSIIERKSAQIKSTMVTTPEKDTSEDKDEKTDKEAIVDKDKEETAKKDNEQITEAVTSTIKTGTTSSTRTTSEKEKEISTTITKSKEQTTSSSASTTNIISATSKPISRPAPRTRTPPKVFPAKSLKDENNRKVAESKPMRTAPIKIVSSSKTTKKEEETIVKAEKKPIVKRTKPPVASTPAAASAKALAPVKPSSPVKVTRKPITITTKKLAGISDDKKLKPDNEKTDSSAVSTPSTLEADTTLLKTKTKSESIKPKSIESAKETNKSTAIKKIRPKPKPTSETQSAKSSGEPAVIKPTTPAIVPPTTTYVSNIITKQGDDEEDEILIIETTEMKSVPKHDYEEQKYLRDQKESEKEQKIKDLDVSKSKQEQSLDFAKINEKKGPQPDDKAAVKLTPEDKEKIFGEVQGIISTAAEMIATSKPAADQKVVSPADKPESTKPQVKELLHASQETSSTTAPTMPEDEKIDFDEPKPQEEIEEKYDKEETKEKSPENGQKSKIDARIPLKEQTSEDIIRKAKRDIVKTPDEVADLPVHEEVDIPEYKTRETKNKEFITSVTTEEPKIEVVKPEHPEFVTITPTSSPDEKPLPTMTSSKEKDLADATKPKSSVKETITALKKDSLTETKLFEKVIHESDVSPKSSPENVQVKDNLSSDEFITIDLNLRKPSTDTTSQDELSEKETPSNLIKEEADNEKSSAVQSRRTSKEAPLSTYEKSEKISLEVHDKDYKQSEKPSSLDQVEHSSLINKALDPTATSQSPLETTKIDEQFDKLSRKQSLKEPLEQLDKSTRKESLKESSEQLDKLLPKESLKESPKEISKSSESQRSSITKETLDFDKTCKSAAESETPAEKVDSFSRKESLKILQEEISKTSPEKSPSSTEDKLDPSKMAFSPTKLEEKLDQLQRKESMKIFQEEEESLKDVPDETAKLSSEKSPTSPEDQFDQNKIPLSLSKLSEKEQLQRKESLKSLQDDTYKLPSDKLSSSPEDKLDQNIITSSPPKFDEKERKQSLKNLKDESSSVKDELDQDKVTLSSSKSDEQVEHLQRKESLKSHQTEISKSPSEKSPSSPQDTSDQDKSPSKLDGKQAQIQRKELLLDKTSTLQSDKSPTPTEGKLNEDEIDHSPSKLDYKLDQLHREQSLKDRQDETSKLPSEKSQSSIKDGKGQDKTVLSTSKVDEKPEQSRSKESMAGSLDATIKSDKSPSSPEDQLSKDNASQSPTESTKSPEKPDEISRKESLKEFLDETSKSFQTKSHSLSIDGSELTKSPTDSIKSEEKSETFQRKESLEEISKPSSPPDEKLLLSEKETTVDKIKPVTTDPSHLSFDENTKSTRKQSVTFNDESLEIIPSEDLSSDQFIVCKNKLRKRSITDENFLDDDDDRISPKSDNAVPEEESHTGYKTEMSASPKPETISPEKEAVTKASPTDKKSVTTTDAITLEKSLSTTEKVRSDQSLEEKVVLKDSSQRSKSNDSEISTSAKTGEPTLAEIIKDSAFDEKVIMTQLDSEIIKYDMKEPVSPKVLSPETTKDDLCSLKDDTKFESKEPSPTDTQEKLKSVRKESLPQIADEKISPSKSPEKITSPEKDVIKPKDEINATEISEQDSKELSSIEAPEKSAKKESCSGIIERKVSLTESVKEIVSLKNNIEKSSPIEVLGKSTRKESLSEPSDKQDSLTKAVQESALSPDEVIKLKNEIDTNKHLTAKDVELAEEFNKHDLPKMATQQHSKEKISPTKSFEKPILHEAPITANIDHAGSTKITKEGSKEDFTVAKAIKEQIPSSEQISTILEGELNSEKSQKQESVGQTSTKAFKEDHKLDICEKTMRESKDGSPTESPSKSPENQIPPEKLTKDEFSPTDVSKQSSPIKDATLASSPTTKLESEEKSISTKTSPEQSPQPDDKIKTVDGVKQKTTDGIDSTKTSRESVPQSSLTLSDSSGDLKGGSKKETTEGLKSPTEPSSQVLAVENSLRDPVSHSVETTSTPKDDENMANEDDQNELSFEDALEDTSISTEAVSLTTYGKAKKIPKQKSKEELLPDEALKTELNFTETSKESALARKDPKILSTVSKQESREELTLDEVLRKSSIQEPTFVEKSSPKDDKTSIPQSPKSPVSTDVSRKSSLEKPSPIKEITLDEVLRKSSIQEETSKTKLTSKEPTFVEKSSPKDDKTSIPQSPKTPVSTDVSRKSSLEKPSPIKDVSKNESQVQSTSEEFNTFAEKSSKTETPSSEKYDNLSTLGKTCEKSSALSLQIQKVDPALSFEKQESKDDQSSELYSEPEKSSKRTKDEKVSDELMTPVDGHSPEHTSPKDSHPADNKPNSDKPSSLESIPDSSEISKTRSSSPGKEPVEGKFKLDSKSSPDSEKIDQPSISSPSLESSLSFEQKTIEEACKTDKSSLDRSYSETTDAGKSSMDTFAWETSPVKTVPTDKSDAKDDTHTKSSDVLVFEISSSTLSTSRTKSVGEKQIDDSSFKTTSPTEEIAAAEPKVLSSASIILKDCEDFKADQKSADVMYMSETLDSTIESRKQSITDSKKDYTPDLQQTDSRKPSISTDSQKSSIVADIHHTSSDIPTKELQKPDSRKPSISTDSRKSSVVADIHHTSSDIPTKELQKPDSRKPSISTDSQKSSIVADVHYISSDIPAEELKQTDSRKPSISTDSRKSSIIADVHYISSEIPAEELKQTDSRKPSISTDSQKSSVIADVHHISPDLPIKEKENLMPLSIQKQKSDIEKSSIDSCKSSIASVTLQHTSQHKLDSGSIETSRKENLDISSNLISSEVRKSSHSIESQISSDVSNKSTPKTPSPKDLSTFPSCDTSVKLDDLKISSDEKLDGLSESRKGSTAHESSIEREQLSESRKRSIPYELSEQPIKASVEKGSSLARESEIGDPHKGSRSSPSDFQSSSEDVKSPLSTDKSSPQSVSPEQSKDSKSSPLIDKFSSGAHLVEQDTKEVKLNVAHSKSPDSLTQSPAKSSSGDDLKQESTVLTSAAYNEFERDIIKASIDSTSPITQGSLETSPIKDASPGKSETSTKQSLEESPSFSEDGKTKSPVFTSTIFKESDRSTPTDFQSKISPIEPSSLETSPLKDTWPKKTDYDSHFGTESMILDSKRNSYAFESRASIESIAGSIDGDFDSKSLPRGSIDVTTKSDTHADDYVLKAFQSATTIPPDFAKRASITSESRKDSLGDPASLTKTITETTFLTSTISDDPKLTSIRSSITSDSQRSSIAYELDKDGADFLPTRKSSNDEIKTISQDLSSTVQPIHDENSPISPEKQEIVSGSRKSSVVADSQKSSIQLGEISASDPFPTTSTVNTSPKESVESRKSSVVDSKRESLVTETLQETIPESRKSSVADSKRGSPVTETIPESRKSLVADSKRGSLVSETVQETIPESRKSSVADSKRGSLVTETLQETIPESRQSSVADSKRGSLVSETVQETIPESRKSSVADSKRGSLVSETVQETIPESRKSSVADSKRGSLVTETVQETIPESRKSSVADFKPGSPVTETVQETIPESRKSSVADSKRGSLVTETVQETIPESRKSSVADSKRGSLVTETVQETIPESRKSSVADTKQGSLVTETVQETIPESRKSSVADSKRGSLVTETVQETIPESRKSSVADSKRGSLVTGTVQETIPESRKSSVADTKQGSLVTETVQGTIPESRKSSVADSKRGSLVTETVQETIPESRKSSVADTKQGSLVTETVQETIPESRKSSVADSKRGSLVTETVQETIPESRKSSVADTKQGRLVTETVQETIPESRKSSAADSKRGSLVTETVQETIPESRKSSVADFKPGSPVTETVQETIPESRKSSVADSKRGSLVTETVQETIPESQKSSVADSKRGSLVTETVQETIPESQKSSVADSKRGSLVTETVQETIPESRKTSVADSKRGSLVTETVQETIPESRKTSVADSKRGSLVTEIVQETIPESQKSSVADSKRGSLVTETVQETIPESQKSSIAGSTIDQRKCDSPKDFKERESKTSPHSNAPSEIKHITETSTKTWTADITPDSRKSSSASFVEPTTMIQDSKKASVGLIEEPIILDSRKSSLVSDSRKASLGLNLSQITTTSQPTETSISGPSKEDTLSRKASVSSDIRRSGESVAPEHLTTDFPTHKDFKPVSSTVTSKITETITDKSQYESKTIEIVSESNYESSVSDIHAPVSEASTKSITKTPLLQQSITDSRKSSITDSRKGSIISDFGGEVISYDSSPQNTSSPFCERKTDSRKASSDLPLGSFTIESSKDATTSEVSTKGSTQEKFIESTKITAIGSKMDIPLSEDATITSIDSCKGSLDLPESQKARLPADDHTNIIDSLTKTASEFTKQNIMSTSESVTASSASSLQSKTVVESSTTSDSSTDARSLTSKQEILSSTFEASKTLINTVSPSDVSTTILSTSSTRGGVESGVVSSTIEKKTTIVEEQIKDEKFNVSGKTVESQSSQDSKISSSDIATTKRDGIPGTAQKSTSSTFHMETSPAEKSSIIKDVSPSGSLSSSSTMQKIIVHDGQISDSLTMHSTDHLTETIKTYQTSKDITDRTSDSGSPDGIPSRKLFSHQLGTVTTLETCDIDLSHRSPSPDFHSHKSATYTFTTIGSPDDSSSLTDLTRHDLGNVEHLNAAKSDLKSSIITEDISQLGVGQDSNKTISHTTSVESKTSNKATKTTTTLVGDSETGTSTTKTAKIITSESPAKTVTQDAPITLTTSTTHVETISEVDPSSIDLAKFAALSSSDQSYPGANTTDGTYSTIEYQTITKYVVIPSADGSPSRIKKYTTEIIPTSVREISRAEYEKLHDVDASAAGQQEISGATKPTLRDLDSKSYDSFSQIHPSTTVSSTIKHDPVTKSISEPHILPSPDLGALHMDANQMRVQFLADSSASVAAATVKKSATGAVISKASSDETYDSTVSDTLSDLSSNKFYKKETVSKTVSLPILDEVAKQSIVAGQPDTSEDISRSLTFLEKISCTDGAKAAILSDPSSLNKQPEDGELPSKSVSLPVIKRPDDSAKYMTLPNLYKTSNLEDLSAEDKIIEERTISTETLSSTHTCATGSAIAPIKESEESFDDENQPTLIRQVIETTTKITSQLVGALQSDSSSPQRSQTPYSESDDGRSDISLEQCSRITQHSGGAGRDSSQICESDEESSIIPYLKEDDQIPDQFTGLQEEAMRRISSSMTQSFYGTYPDDEEDENDLPEDSRTPSAPSTAPQPPQDQATGDKKDPIKDWGRPLGLPNVRNVNKFLIWNPIEEWGRPLGLPMPAPPPSSVQDRESNGDIEINLAPINPPTNNNVTKGTPTKKVPKKSAATEKINTARETSKTRDSSVKRTKPTKPTSPVYVDLAYVPHHGNPYYTTVEFFKRIRARYYVFSGTDPSKDVFNALIDAKKTWEDQNLEVTIIPTYDTDVLGYWITENEEILTNLKIDLSPSASRCTINLQDHDTSCSAYRLEF